MRIVPSQIPYVAKSHNAEHDYVFNKLVEAIPLAFATKYNFTAYYDRMTRALDDENASYTRVTKYANTEAVNSKDDIRDNQFRRLKFHFQSAELDTDPAVVVAAKKCLEGIGSQNPTGLSYVENTAAVRDIVDRLESDEYAEAVALVGATQMVADLKAANEDFDATYSARTQERYARSTSAPDMRTARSAMEAAYADVADIVNALYIQSSILSPDEETLSAVTAIANEINAQVSQFTLVLSHRGVGSATTPDTPDPSTPEDPDPGQGGDESGTPEGI